MWLEYTFARRERRGPILQQWHHTGNEVFRDLCILLEFSDWKYLKMASKRENGTRTITKMS